MNSSKIANNDLFQEVSHDFLNKNFKISNEIISKIYSSLRFFYLNCKSKGVIHTQSYIDFFNKSKLIIYKIIPLNCDVCNQSEFSNEANVVICIEKQCYIILNIYIKLFRQILNQINSLLIDISDNIPKINDEEIIAFTEINSLHNYFRTKISNNEFVIYTCDPIFAFMIRKNYFSSSILSILKNGNKINDYFSQPPKNIKNEIEIVNPGTKPDIKYYQKNDFIILRSIFSSGTALFTLSLYKKDLELYVLKEYYKIEKNFYHEIEFCNNYLHHCMRHFYGFLKYNNNHVNGFVYEFMSNGTLSHLIKTHPDKVDDKFIVQTIYRVFQAINYLHSNNLIHRDIKPDNILINNDFLPFLSDYDQIRCVNLRPGEQMTQDIGSFNYASPEQLNKKEAVSFPTDFYSFGKLIYFLYEKKDMPTNIQNLQMEKVPKEIQNLVIKCVKTDINERPTIDEIKGSIYLLFGMLFYEGKSIEQNFSKAEEFFNYSADLNNPCAFYYLGMIYSEGKGVDKNYKKAMAYFEEASKYDHADSIFELGRFYDYGFGVEVDKSKAKEYYLKAAEMNQSYAINTLGYFYFLGDGFEKDYFKALEYFEKAAALKNPYAINNVGYHYYTGKGVEKIDYEKAKYYFELSASYNTDIAYYNLGNIYYYGYGVTKDIPKARHYFKLAAAQKHSDSMIYLGKIYYNGLNVAKNIDKAKKYFKMAAKLKNSNAFLKLGQMYLRGLGVDVNYAKAKKYFKTSGFINNSKAILNLGLMYYKGIGVEQNFYRAKEYFEISSMKGNLTAHFYLGLLNENGEGCERDLSKAIDHYSKCSETHDHDVTFSYDDEHCSYEKTKINKHHYISCNALGLIYITEEKLINHQKAEDYLKKAGLNEYPFGQTCYALFNQYYKGNLENAKYFFNKAAKKHFSMAEFNLGHICEQEGKINEAISHYLQAIEYFYEPFYFRKQLIDDERLEISKTFVFCFMNLKLAKFYLENERTNVINAQIHFLKSILVPIFKLIFNSKQYSYCFSKRNGNLSDFILSFPLFNLNSKNAWKKYKSHTNTEILISNGFSPCQIANNAVFIKRLISNENKEIPSIDIKTEIEKVFEKVNNQKKYSIHIKDLNNIYEIIFTNCDNNKVKTIRMPKSLNEFLFGKKKSFKDEIDDTLSKMNDILFALPYSILFGRMRNNESEKSTFLKEINGFFYEGLGDII